MFEHSTLTSSARPSLSGVPTVFVVEDDKASRDALLFLFSSSGLPVRAFASAEEFLAAGLVAGAGCLILDIHLTGMSGFDLLDQMPEGVAALPVICITGRSNAHLRARAREADVFSFVEKPVADEHLLHLVRDAIDQSLDDGGRKARSA